MVEKLYIPVYKSPRRIWCPAGTISHDASPTEMRLSLGDKINVHVAVKKFMVDALYVELHRTSVISFLTGVHDAQTGKRDINAAVPSAKRIRRP